MIASIARAARAGILLKGGIYLEQLAKVRVLAFDKTGTLTVGRPAVVRIERFDDSVSDDELLRLAAAAERRSSHPLAKAVVERAEQAGVQVPEPATFEVIRGRGIKADQRHASCQPVRAVHEIIQIDYPDDRNRGHGGNQPTMRIG